LGPLSAWRSIESTTILATHPSLLRSRKGILMAQDLEKKTNKKLQKIVKNILFGDKSQIKSIT